MNNKTPYVVLAGRTNVGKSTIFNRLLGQRRAIVAPCSHITRDYVEGYCEGFVLVDTAGLGDNLTEEYAKKSLEAVSISDLLFFVIDGRLGVTDDDRISLKNVRKHNPKRILLVANKSDCKPVDDHNYLSLGLGEPLHVSAEHNIGIGDLHYEINNISSQAIAGKPIKMALIGQPNAGKSSLVNQLLGYKRQVVSDVPGTTREAIGVRFEFQGQQVEIIDNAGTRRRYPRDHSSIENQGMRSSFRAIEEADVVLLMLDGSTNSLKSQDLRLAREVAERNKPMVVAVNKCDMMSDVEQFLDRVKDVSGAIFAHSPTLGISAKTGYGCEKLISIAMKLRDRSLRRISTRTLNEWLEEASRENSPKMTDARKTTKLKYMVQCGESPLRFRIYINTVDDNLGDSYKRYLVNKMRRDFNLHGVPIVLKVLASKNPYSKAR